jgi:N-acetylglucosamine-6-phosphate deacetylase
MFIYADKFFYANEVKSAGYLAIVDGKFGDYQTEVPEGSEVVDYTGYYIAPGLVDTHIHGLLGKDVMDNNYEDVIDTMSVGLLSCGVTSFLPTTLTAQAELLKEVSKGIGDHYQEAKGAKIRGIYYEGPFFTETYKGAQNPAYMTDPSIEIFEEWQKAANGLIKKIAVAPERECVEEFVSAVTKTGVVVALGHSNATYEQAERAVDAGASVWVHAFNGMRGLNHREPGMVGAVMNLKETYAELICDGHHVQPAAANILMDAKGRHHVALITDCMRAGAMPEGQYTLGEFAVEVKDGQAKLENGSLAGSIAELKNCVKNVVDWNIATAAEAIRMATLIPAISSKIDDVCGQIKAGHDADFIVLDPQLNLEATYLDGEKRY